jgi:hypothetical protein
VGSCRPLRAPHRRRGPARCGAARRAALNARLSARDVAAPESPARGFARRWLPPDRDRQRRQRQTRGKRTKHLEGRALLRCMERSCLSRGFRFRADGGDGLRCWSVSSFAPRRTASLLVCPGAPSPARPPTSFAAARRTRAAVRLAGPRPPAASAGRPDNRPLRRSHRRRLGPAQSESR